MPILYKNIPNNNMKTIQELSQQEAIDWITIRNLDPLNGYTITQANRLTELVKTFIDPKQRSCAHCGTTGNLREAKDKFIRFYLDNETNIKFISEGISPFAVEVEKEILTEVEPLSSVDVAIIASEIITEDKPKNKRKKK